MDGNGRIGRLLLSLLLVGWNLLPLPLLHLSAYIEPHRQEYYDLLLAVSQRGAWREWILFFMRAVTSQAQDTGLQIKQIQDLQKNWHSHLRTARAPDSSMQLTDFLFEQPIITIPAAQRVLSMTHRGATLVVQKLVDLGILSSIPTDGHTRYFGALNILEIIRRGQPTQKP